MNRRQDLEDEEVPAEIAAALFRVVGQVQLSKTADMNGAEGGKS